MRAMLIGTVLNVAIIAIALGVHAYSKPNPVVDTTDPTAKIINRLNVCYEYPDGSVNKYLCVKKVTDIPQAATTQQITAATTQQVAAFAPMIVPPIRRHR